MNDHSYSSTASAFRRAPKVAAARPRRTLLEVEALEDRVTPTVFNVNSLADTLNPGNPNIMTLR
jgi:hypothetical protein